MKRFLNPMTIGLIGIMGYMAITRGNFSNPMDWIMGKLYILPGIIIGLAFHEFAHAAVAAKLGDNTPKLQGRVTINPGAHIDPVGMVALLLVGFGWGRPVEINPKNFKNRRRDELLVAIAGVTMNLIIAIIFTFVLKIVMMISGVSIFTMAQGGGMMGSVMTIIFYVIHINLVLMVFNLLPVPPLDGFNIITEVLNLKRYSWWYDLYSKGMLILLVLILFNVTGRVLGPAIAFVWSILERILYI